MTSSVDIALQDLPLRPTTLNRLQQRGFGTVKEVREAKTHQALAYHCGGSRNSAGGISSASGSGHAKGSIGNFAAELGVGLAEAARIYQEVTQAAANATTATTSAEAPTATAAQNGDRHFQQHQDQQPAEQQAKTATALLREQDGVKSGSSHGAIITFCRAVDNLLGGGLATGEVTELAGPPGVGKTQWAMQCACTASLPEQFGGVSGECCYLDTEGSFAPERAYAMAHGLVEHLQKTLERRKRHGRAPLPPLPETFTAESILRGIHVFRIHDEAALVATLYGSVPALLQDRADAGFPIKLLIVDSVAFHYRAAGPDTDFVARTQSLTAACAQLQQLAAGTTPAAAVPLPPPLSVLAINQMTTKLVPGGAGSRLVPALGESWAHAVTTRLILSFGDGCSSSGGGTSATDYNNENSVTMNGNSDNNIYSNNNNNKGFRTCTLVKSPHLPPGSAEYCIVENGIRDTSEYHHDHQGKTTRTSKTNSSSKRLRTAL